MRYAAVTCCQTRPGRTARPGPGPRHAFGPAMAAALRAAGLTVELRGDEWLPVVFHGADAS